MKETKTVTAYMFHAKKKSDLMKAQGWKEVSCKSILSPPNKSGKIFRIMVMKFERKTESLFSEKNL